MRLGQKVQLGFLIQIPIVLLVSFAMVDVVPTPFIIMNAVAFGIFWMMTLVFVAMYLLAFGTGEA